MILQMQNIVKEFSGVRALNGVSFEVKKNTVHALCGENGAGKSTLMKILSGVYPYRTFDGEIIFDGEKQKFKTLSESENRGIAIIAQELALVPEMSIAENIFLGRAKTKTGIIQWNEIYSEAKTLLTRLGINTSVHSLVKDVGIGVQQLVEIAKALSKNAKLLILDEPTAALSEQESQHLLKILIELRNNGITSILVSHKLKEVLAVADNITVLRDGSSVGTLTKAEATEEKIVALMVGRELKDLFHKENISFGDVVLKVENLFAFDKTIGAQKIKCNLLEVKAGEIIGIAGLMGAGRTELLQTLFGTWPGKITGSIYVNGNLCKNKQPSDAIKNGMALVSEDRKKYGLLLQENIVINTTLASVKKFVKHFTLQKNKEKEKALSYKDALNIKTSSITNQLLYSLSGGNQQKVVLAKWLLTQPKVLLMDEPTRGIDIGAKGEIYSLIQELAKKGTAILIVSSELQELIGICDRIYVMDKGEIKTCLQRDEATQEKIMQFATGVN